MNEPRKYLPISAFELEQLLVEAKLHYLCYCKLSGHAEGKDSDALKKEALGHLKKSTGIFDEAMRRVALDYSDGKYQMLDDYYRYVRIEEAWGTRLWMNLLYNLLGFPKTFWLMRHLKWLL